MPLGPTETGWWAYGDDQRRRAR